MPESIIVSHARARRALHRHLMRVPQLVQIYLCKISVFYLSEPRYIDSAGMRVLAEVSEDANALLFAQLLKVHITKISYSNVDLLHNLHKNHYSRY